MTISPLREHVPPDGARSASEVADPSLAAVGRREIELAETEMPGLMALRRQLGPAAPLAGARITGLLHTTVQTAVLVETLQALGAQVRWASSSPVSTQDHAAAALAAVEGTSVFAWKEQTPDEFWWCARQALAWPDGGGPNLLLDDGAGLTRLLSAGIAHEVTGSTDIVALDEAAHRMLADEDPQYWRRVASGVRGASEETTTGALHLQRLSAAGVLPFPAVSVNDSVTKSKFDNRYGCRHSLIDGLNRATDVLLGGKLAVVCGYGDVGKGCADALRGQGARVVVTEVDPICALQAAMDGYQVLTLERVVAEADVVITATGNDSVVTVEHMAAMKHRAIVGNMGHSEREIDFNGLVEDPRTRRVPVKPQVDEWVFEDGHSVVLLSEGRLLNLGNATGHPSFVMSASFSNQVLAQVELHSGAVQEGGVHTLSRLLDEKVAQLHLDALRVELTTLTQHQADVLGVPLHGPFKSDNYRY
ncbi:adenosylhomocysteinase [Umezawaea tangerina]|uniref:Adenosylhomocysteinase n=1 Tax=Umezawaea tangerina TaxID=84725 RepID=A0A2T0T497_9PSEU|nr:adenosylhomocysteinase [Umezawaea tangerina]PRY40487.1 adenosylhomocysteinase [Umezawaea tangerina]